MFTVSNVRGYMVVADSPYGVAVSRDKSYVFLTHNIAGEQIRRYNYSDITAGNTGFTVVDTGNVRGSVTVVGDYVYYGKGSSIYRSPVGSVSPQLFMANPSGSMSGLGTDGANLFFVNTSGNVYRIDVNTKSAVLETTIPSVARYDSFSVSTDSYFTTADSDRGKVRRYSRSSGSLVDTVDLSTSLSTFQSFFINPHSPNTLFTLNPGGNPSSIAASSSLQDCITESTVSHSLSFAIVNTPAKPSNVRVSFTNYRVGSTLSTFWKKVSTPSQPSGINLSDKTVYYNLEFFDGVSWRTISARTTRHQATDPNELYINYTVPTIADTNQARVRVRAFVEHNGTKHYGDWIQTVTFNVFSNNKPTVPTSFVSPVASSRYRVGFNYTPSWGASTDLDNDPITYQLDFFNGSTWTNVASGLQTTNRSFIVPSGPDTLNAQFRVRAYDGRDYSDYRYSDKFEVFNSLPPNTPRPFTKPMSGEMRIIDQQTAYDVTWGHADADRPETIVKYEISFRPTTLDNWVVIRDINHPDANKTSMKHIIPNVQDSPSAQYRVRAYDGYEYGGYTESNQFNVSANKVTNTSGFNQELMDRMAINQEVRLSWQPAETARGTAVVYDIEVFDGFNWYEVAYNVPTTSLVFRIPPMEDTPNAKIRIRSKTPFQYGGYVESDWVETSPFTIVNFFIFDSIAVPFLNDVQKKENADYLRQKVNDMRIVNDLAPLVYTDPVIIRYETAIKAVHFDEIERGILECFDTNPRASFKNARTEQELRKVKEYSDQAELIQELPQRIDFICKALMNQ